MTDADARRLREEYLASLDAAMIELPYRVATDIRHGIDEELSGLDATQTAARIMRMGAPESIAREAAAAVELAPADRVAPAAPAAPAAVPPRAIEDSKGFAIAAALVFAFGGFVIPILGAAVGIVLVAMSRRWHRWEKLVAVLVPAGAAVVTGAIGWISGIGRSAQDAMNPLLPASYDTLFSGVVLGLMLMVVCGLWLLWRLRRDQGMPDASTPVSR